MTSKWGLIVSPRYLFCQVNSHRVKSTIPSTKIKIYVFDAKSLSLSLSETSHTTQSVPDSQSNIRDTYDSGENINNVQSARNYQPN